MAHRKPLGTTCRISFDRGLWSPMPEIGDYLESEAGTAYRVVGLEEGPSRFTYLCERIAEVPAIRDQHHWVFPFYWLPRDRRAA